jgi:hypothetical protein
VTGATIQCLSHSANPAIEIWSWSSESNTRRRGTSSLHSHCARPANFWSWRGDSNADHGLTRPELFPLSYTSTKTSSRQSGGGGENCTPDDLLCRETPCCLGYTASNSLTKSGAEGGTRTRALDVGNVASWPLDDFRPHKIMERAARIELASSGWKPEAPAAIPCSLFKLAGVTGFEPA